MPSISRFFGITIYMYWDETGLEPPHFHAVYAESMARIRIDTLEVLTTSLPRRQLRMTLAWAELHREELAVNWARARRHETLLPIPPLA